MIAYRPNSRFLLPKVAIPLLLLAIVGSSIAAVRSADVIAVFNPEQRKARDAPFPLAAAILTLPDDFEAGYRQISEGQVIKRDDGRAVAQLAGMPNPLRSASANLPELAAIDEARAGFVVHASLRYVGGGQVVYVNSGRPTAAALEREIVFGQRTVTLADGTTAWTAAGIPEEATNMVATIRDGLIIQITGSLPLERLEELLAQVVIP